MSWNLISNQPNFKVWNWRKMSVRKERKKLKLTYQICNLGYETRITSIKNKLKKKTMKSNP
jgi:hypothetical protein